MKGSSQSKRLPKMLRRGLILFLGVMIVVVIVIFSLGPTVVAKSFNTVGEAPLLPIDPVTQALHQSLTVVDLHADSLLWGRDLSKRVDYGHVDVPRLLQGNVALQVFTAVTKVPVPLNQADNSDDSDSVIKLAILQRWPISAWFSLAERALYQANQLHRLERKSPDTFRIITTQQGLNDYLAQRETNQQLTAGLLGIEGAQVLEGTLDNLDRLYEAGYRLIGLTHFFDNEVAGSAHGLSDGGLTEFGRAVIQQMEAWSMTVDLAHASPQAIDDVLAMTQRPVLVSHTGVQGTCEGIRNLSDRQVQQIAQTGGVIGIGFWKTAVCGDDARAVVRAMRYVADLVDADHVALGSDFDGAVRVPFDVADINQVTAALRQDGFAETDIRKIMGLNVIRLLQTNLPQ